MAREKVSRNDRCPCGSGKKYKVCCLKKGIDFQQDDNGKITRSVPLTPEVASIVEQQRQAFIEHFGREPRQDEPLFFDMPPADQIQAEMAADMRAAGIDPAIVYAFEKTGLLATEQNEHLIPDKDLAEWDDAVDEYEAMHGTGDEG